MILASGTVDVSIELSKIGSFAGMLATEIHDRAHEKPESSEERRNLEALYWVADTIRETAEKAYSDLYPNERL